ncbi:MAG: hypothetical protein QXS79_02345 [Candidatus Bathyarchaeia archaeon]
MVVEESLVEFIKGQIAVEREIVRSLEEALEDMRNPAVKGVLRGISPQTLLSTLRCIPQPYRS